MKRFYLTLSLLFWACFSRDASQNASTDSARESLSPGRAAFRALPPHPGTLTLPWMNGETQVLKDRFPNSAGELFGFGWSGKLYLYKSGDNGQSWSFVDPIGGESIGTYRLMSASQDSSGKVHLLYTDIGAVSYARIALTRTAGVITGFSSEVKRVSLPGSYNSNNDVRGSITPVTDMFGTECLVFAVNDNPYTGTRFRLQMGRSSLVPNTTADFARLDGSPGATVAFTASYTNHDHNALFAQVGTSKDIWVFLGPVDAEYGYPDPTFMTRIKLTPTGGRTWTVGTPITMVGSDAQSSPELLSLVGTQNYVWMLYLNPATGLTFDRVGANGTYETNVIPNPEGLAHRNGWGVFSVADDEQRVWLIWNLLTGPDRQFITRQAFFNGATWTQYSDSAPFLGDSWGFAGSSGWNEGVVAVRLDGVTNGIQLSSVYGGVLGTGGQTAPLITTQPTSISISEGQTATFSISATGNPAPSFQWRKDDVAISGANSSSYTTAPTTISDNGAQFTVVVSNSAGTVTSSGATLTVSASTVAPSITSQPQSAVVSEGQAATFSVSATGNPAPSFQWWRSGAPIAGANSASYRTPPAMLSDNGAQFAVVVSNSAGTVTSAVATLTVFTPSTVAPSITSQPQSAAVTEGQVATFSVSATGNPVPSFQWWRSGAPIAGANSSSYRTPTATLSDNGAQFAVVVSNSAGTVTSMVVTLTVNASTFAPSITAQPQSTAVSEGQSATFSASATGNPAPTYQWLRNGSAITGATSASYTTPPVSAADNQASFRVVATNSVGSATSNAATLTVNTSGVSTSCAAIKSANPSAVNGTYSIDPDGAGANAPFNVFCDMTTQGGGWTVIYESGSTKKATTALDYTVKDATLRNGAAEVLLAFRNASLELYSLGHTARLALPDAWKTQSPFRYSNSDLMVNVFIDAATTPVTQRMRYGYRDLAGERCTDGWYLGGNEGRLCIENTNAPFYMGFASSIDDGCTDSNRRVFTRLCSTDLRFSIAVR